MIIHWFRRDLRLSDNHAFSAAYRESNGAVLPLFVLDDRLFRGRFASANRSAWLLASLAALDEQLRARGSRLVLLRGEPQAVILELARTTAAQAVFWNRDYSPFAIARDSAIKAALREQGCAAKSFKDLVIFEMGEIVSGSGTPYSVYTPYARAWRKQLAAQGGALLHPAPETLTLPANAPHEIALPSLAEFGLHSSITLPAAGEIAAQAGLNHFCDRRVSHSHSIASYALQRNSMALPATSRLSPHFRLGSLSVRQALAAAQTSEDEGASTWVGELIWRDFYNQVLYHHPHVLRGSFKPNFDAIRWPNDEALFAAWCEGRTGYPVVDAAMRQLRAEGWMHNRARMIVASFLTKDLLIDWRWGERFFMQHLIDGDPAANNGGWQWAAGTGTDAQPYFRIFNPTTQGKNFDPEGNYVRRYVPELAKVPAKQIHEPWLLGPADQRRFGVEIGRDYPRPIVDHAVQRTHALELYAVAKGEDRS